MADDAALDLTTLTADVAAAYVSHNKVAAGDLAGLIHTIHAALTGVAAEPARHAEPRAPAVPIRKSVNDEFVVCLEDGRKFRSMTRYLRVRYGLTPAEYRAKWGLPMDYPMVAPAYAAARSAHAKQIGLGRGPRGAKTGRPATV